MKNIKSDRIIDSIMESKRREDLIKEFYELVDDEDVSILGESTEFEPLYHEESYFDNVNKLDEAKTVTFGGNTFPTSGWAVVLSGGPGSGKGYTINNRLTIDAKVFDVDRLKELYVGVLKSGKENSIIKKKDTKGDYDFKNSEDVERLHDIVSTSGYEKSSKDAFFSNVRKDNLPNVIFDITGKGESKLIKISGMLKDMGYMTSLVWVVTNREVAMLRNFSRARVVSQSLLHDIHNKVNDTIFPFLQSDKAKDFNEAWVVFSSPDSLKELSKEEQKEFNKMSVVKFIKNGPRFEIPDEVMARTYKVLGENEPDIGNPSIYKSYDDAKKELDPFLKTETKDNVGYLNKTVTKKSFKGYGDLSFKKSK